MRKRDHGIQILYKKDCKIISDNNIPAVSPEKIDGKTKMMKKIIMFKKDLTTMGESLIMVIMRD